MTISIGAIGSPWVYDASFVKLREARATISVPLHRFGAFSAQRLRVSLDVFNIFNSDTVLTLRNNSSQVTATTPWAQSF